MEGIQIIDQQVGYNDDIMYLKVNGYIDTHTSLKLVSRLKEFLDAKIAQFVLDLSSVNYVSSAGWGVFVGEIKNVRESGGDIKLVNMVPEVYDVFEMLEFNRILKMYDSVEEAINEFDLIRGYDITQTPIKKWKEDSTTIKSFPDMQVLRATTDKKDNFDPTQISMTNQRIDPTYLSLQDKIKHLITEKPLLSIGEMKGKLRSASYGKSKVGILKLYFLLKDLNLETKEKRHRFYRSR